jgi:methyl-accepting chemotaxis protein
MLIILLSGIVGFVINFGINYSFLQHNVETIGNIVTDKLPSVKFLEYLSMQITSVKNAYTQAVLSQNFQSLGHIEEADKDALKSFESLINLDGHEVEHLKVSQKKYITTKKNLDSIVENIVSGISTLAQTQNEFQAQLDSLGELDKQIHEIKARVDDQLVESVMQANESGRTAIFIGGVLLGVAVFLSIFFYFITRTVTGSLSETNSSIQKTSNKLLGMVNEAKVTSSNLKNTANRQATSSTETVVSMEQMKRLLSQTSKISMNALELSEASWTESNNGINLARTLKDFMSEIEESNKELEEVTHAVQMIEEETKIINDIVFKTQILSFNANIEAARAGQHGLGFAVVASEIANLADMSGKAAEQINELLGVSAKKVDSTVSRTKEKIEKANELSGQCYEFFEVLTERSSQLKEIIKTISSAASEQSTGVEYVVNAMNDLSQTAAETDRMASNLANLAESLNGNTGNLVKAVVNLNRAISGKPINSNITDINAVRKNEPPKLVVVDKMKDSA